MLSPALLLFPWVNTVTTSAATSSTNTEAAVVTTVRRFALNTTGSDPYRLLQGVVRRAYCALSGSATCWRGGTV